MEDQNEELNKVVLIGESGVGKTCIINQFITGEFEEDSLPTLTNQFCRKQFDFPDNKSISIDIWDTAGQEQYRSLNRLFYKNAKAVILVYDVSNKLSFDEIKNYWYDQIKQHCDNNIIIAVAGNKCDLYEKRQILDEEGEKYAESINAIFAATSAKNASGIKDLFENIALKMIDMKEQKNGEQENENKRKKEGKENNKDNSNKKVKLNNSTKKIRKCC